MSGTGKTRYTVGIQAKGQISLHGVFDERDRARALADQWQKVLDRKLGPDQVVVYVRVLNPASASERDRLWGDFA